jgi:beta-1,4-mannosyltransferase
MTKPFVASVTAWPAYKNRALNTYNSSLYGAVKDAGWNVREFSRSSIFPLNKTLHIHWPDDFDSRLSALSAALRLALVLSITSSTKLAGGRVIWTAHNHTPHSTNHKVLKRIFDLVFPHTVTDVVHLTEGGKRRMNLLPHWARFTGRQHVVPHGPYTIEPHVPTEKPNSPLVVTAIGQVRRYKELVELARTWQTISTNAVLVIAGSVVDPNLQRDLEIIATDEHESRIRLILKRLSDEELSALLSASNAVIVSGQRENSGAVYLALSARRRVLVPATDAMRELATELGTEWVLPYSHTDMSSSIENILSTWSFIAPTSPPSLKSWDEIAHETIEVYLS